MESLLRLSLIMITGFGMPSEANFEHLMGIVSDSICPVFSLSDYKKCIKDFEEELISSEDQSIEILQSRARCCSFTHLKKCVVDATGQSCGQNSAKAVDMIMKSAFEKAKNAVDCRDYDTDLASFVCLPDWSLGLMGLVLLFLVVMAFASTLKMCCSARPYRGVPLTANY